MEFKEIQELIKLVNKSNITKVRIKNGETELTIEQDYSQSFAPNPAVAPALAAAPQQQVAPVAQPAAVAAPQEAPVVASNKKTVFVKSPMVGTFYLSPSPDKPAFVSVGDNITTGKVVCIVEAMKLFNEIESEVSGKIVKILVDDATPVEFDQPLFEVELA